MIDLSGPRDYIIEHGWVQGRQQDPVTGAVCLEGACMAVTGAAMVSRGMNVDTMLLLDEIGRRVSIVTGSRCSGMGVWRWNDDGATLDDVLTILSDKWETMIGEPRFRFR